MVQRVKMILCLHPELQTAVFGMWIVIVKRVLDLLIYSNKMIRNEPNAGVVLELFHKRLKKIKKIANTALPFTQVLSGGVVVFTFVLFS